jgi:hypothetical protein
MNLILVVRFEMFSFLGRIEVGRLAGIENVASRIPARATFKLRLVTPQWEPRLSIDFFPVKNDNKYSLQVSYPRYQNFF